MKARTMFAALALAAWITGVNATQPPVEVSPMEEKARQCSACHGGSGISINAVWPNLAGQKEAYMVKQLKDFRSGKRKDPLMAPIVKQLSDKDIAEFSAYFSSLKPAPGK